LDSCEVKKLFYFSFVLGYVNTPDKKNPKFERSKNIIMAELWSFYLARSQNFFNNSHKKIKLSSRNFVTINKYLLATFCEKMTPLPGPGRV